MSSVQAQGDSGTATPPRTFQPRKRLRPQLDNDSMDVLIGNLCSKDSGQETLALRTLVFMIADFDAAKALWNHRRFKDVLGVCMDAIKGDAKSQDDALSVMVNLLAVPQAQRSVWEGFVVAAMVPGVANKILSHEDMPSIIDHLLHGCDSQNLNAEGPTMDLDLKAASVCVDRKTSFLRCLLNADPSILKLCFVPHFSRNRISCLAQLLIMSSRQHSQDADNQRACVECFVDMSFTADKAFKIEHLLPDHEPLAVEVISFLVRSLLCADQSIPQQCFQALGNYFLDASVANIIVSDAGLFANFVRNLSFRLMSGPSNHESRMASFVLDVLLRKGQKTVSMFCNHADASFIVKFIIDFSSVPFEPEKIPRSIQMLLALFTFDEGKQMLQAPGFAQRIVSGARKLLESGVPYQWSCALCTLLKCVLECTQPALLLFGSTEIVGNFIASLCGLAAGKFLLDALVPLLQWDQKLVRFLSLEYKQKWLSDQIKRAGQNASVHIVAQRQQLLEGLCGKLDKPSDALRSGLDVQFIGDGENGAGDGHRREFFGLAMQELVNENFGLFKSNDGGRSFHISNISANVQPDHLSYFELCGKLLGLALLHRETLPAAQFTSALYKLLLGCEPLMLDDLLTVDPDFYHRKVLYLLDNKYEEDGLELSGLNLTFEDCPQQDIFPDDKHELCASGADLPVTEANKHSYLQLVAVQRMQNGVRKQIEAMVQGFSMLIPESVRSRARCIISPSEMRMLVCGVADLNAEEWKQQTRCAQGLAKEVWDTFWTVVNSMNQMERGQLLEFVTGSPCLPVGGFAALSGYGGSTHGFTVAPPRRQNDSSNMLGLPTAATCFNTLYLPSYPNEAEMRAALREALANRGSGFNEHAVAT